jgi:hypothetical protein
MEWPVNQVQFRRSRSSSMLKTRKKWRLWKINSKLKRSRSWKILKDRKPKLMQKLKLLKKIDKDCLLNLKARMKHNRRRKPNNKSSSSALRTWKTNFFMVLKLCRRRWGKSRNFWNLRRNLRKEEDNSYCFNKNYRQSRISKLICDKTSAVNRMSSNKRINRLTKSGASISKQKVIWTILLKLSIVNERIWWIELGSLQEKSDWNTL